MSAVWDRVADGAERTGVASPVADDERLARALLCRVTEPATLCVADLVERVGPVEALEAIRTGDSGLPQLVIGGIRARLGTARAEADLARAERAGARFVVPGDPEWPTGFNDLLRARKPVFGLYVRGPADLAVAARQAVAIVGARAATDYGTYVAAELAAELSDLGWTVVSGGAYGIDGAAHRGALAAGGCTVAVLACGVDVAYPKGHDALLARIAAEGLVVSEHPPGCAPQRMRFLVRNRLIAALSAGTVVVEAAIRSGASTTAGYASDLSREVMAVPGPVTSALSSGTHHLIRARGATLVTRAVDVLDLVGAYGEDAVAPDRAAPRQDDGLDEVSRRVLDALPVTISVSITELIGNAGLPREEVESSLQRLERRGLAQREDDRWRVTGAVTARPSGGSA